MKRWVLLLIPVSLALLFLVLGGCGGGNNVPSAGDVDEHVIVHPVPRGEWFFKFKKRYAKIEIKFYLRSGHCSVSTSDPETYELAGWKLVGLTKYWINPEGVKFPSSYSLTTEQIIQAIRDSFGVWEEEKPIGIFSYMGTTSAQAGKSDFANVISWRELDDARVVAITYVRVCLLCPKYVVDGKEVVRVVEVDTVFNNRYAWYDFSVPAGYTPDNYCPDRPKFALDIRNTATHEFGHWIGLADLDGDANRDATMYRYTYFNELKNRTLSTGDRKGADLLTP